MPKLSIWVENKPRFNSLLEVDIDPKAERFLVLDRRDFSQIYFGIRPTRGVVKILLPVSLSTGNFLLVGIIDDTSEFNAKFLDSVKLELVNATTVNMNQ
jgi:hypothetical protein